MLRKINDLEEEKENLVAKTMALQKELFQS